MKKIISFLTVFLICVSLCSCAESEERTVGSVSDSSFETSSISESALSEIETESEHNVSEEISKEEVSETSVTGQSENETETEIGYLVELDNYADDEHPYFTVSIGNAEFTDINGETRIIEDEEYSIKSDTSSDEQRAFIEKYLNGVFRILYEASANNNPLMFDSDYNVVSTDGVYSDGYEAVSAVIDIESAVDMLILEELVHNYDVGAGSFYMAVDFSESSIYPKLTFLAPWDFNWAYYDDPYGKYYAGAFQDIMMNEDRSNYWLTMLMKTDWFQSAVKEKWNKLSEKSLLTDVATRVREDVEALRNDLGENQWSIDSAGQIIDFVNGRIKWLDEQWG